MSSLNPSLPLPELSLLLKVSGQAIAERKAQNKLKFYRPYPKQAEFHAAGAHYRERLLMAGNQLGKTLSAGAEVAIHATGRYPDWWTGKVFTKPGAMWVSVVRRGVFRLADGQWSLNGNLPALPHLPAIVETADASGRLWFGYTGNQIARVDGPNVKLFGTADGLNVGNVTAIAGRSTCWSVT